MKNLIYTISLVFFLAGCNEESDANKVQIFTGKYGCTGTKTQLVKCEEKAKEIYEVPVNTPSKGF